MLFVISIAHVPALLRRPERPRPAHLRARTARPPRSRRTGTPSASTSRSRCSTAPSSRAWSASATSRTTRVQKREAPTDDHQVPGARASATRFVRQTSVSSIIKRRPARHALAGRGRLRAVDGRRRDQRDHRRVAPGHVRRPRHRRCRADRLLAAHLLHRPAAAQLRLDQVAAGAVPDLHPVLREPRPVGGGPDPALDHPGRRLRRELRPADPRLHARDHERGLHPHGPRQGGPGAHRWSGATACAPR